MHVINSTDWMLTGSGFWDCFENVLKFLPSVSIHIDYVFMSIRNSGAQFLCVLFWDNRCQMCTTKKCTPCDTFFRNHEPNRVPEMSLSCLQDMPIFYTSGKYELSIHFSLEYCYTTVSVHIILCLSAPLKRMFGAWYKCAQNLFSSRNFLWFLSRFSPVITEPLSFFNEILFLY